ncbi:MAG: sulfotransferase domain-containing protein, partial [Planctomycetales bacterium]|nr:sulfotransferase domain-containing protein [Planctomycetales bacterium]
MSVLSEPTIEQRSDQCQELIAESGVNLIVLGFPKCGTTAFAEWLDGSALVAVSRPKETFRLCPEFSLNQSRTERVGLSTSFRSSDAPWRVEATTLNVYSAALRQALRATPTKVVILLRDPVESVLSWHNQMCQAGIAVSESFDEAWQHGLQLSEELAEGNEFLRAYEVVCSYGRWVSRWLEAIGHDRTLLAYDHEVRSSHQLLGRRLEHFLATSLGLPAEVPVRNQFSAIRFPRAYAMLRRPAFKSAL